MAGPWQNAKVWNQLQQAVKQTAAEAKALAPLLDYARSRGLRVAAEDAGRLGEALKKAGDLKVFEGWIGGQVQAARGMRQLLDAFGDVQRAALSGTAAVAGLAAAASPAHFQTLTGSVSLLAGSVGELFLPAIEQAIDYLQDLDHWVRSLDPETKRQIATWATWGAAVLAAAVILPRVIGFLSALYGVAQLAAGGFMMLAPAVGKAAAALTAFALAHPVLAVLALVGAVLALAGAFGGVSDAVAMASARLEQFEEANERLRSGGRATRQDVERAFEGRAADLSAARQTQAGSAAFRQQYGALRDLARQEADTQNAEQREQMALRAQAVLEETRELNPVSFVRNPLLNRAAYRRQRLIEAGVSPEIAGQLYQQNAMGSSLGGGSLSQGDINNAVNFIRGQGPAARLRQQIAEQALATGQHPGEAGRRQRLTAGHFNAQLGSVESAWQRLQLAAGGGSPLEAEQNRRHLEQLQQLQRIASNTDPNRPPQGPPQPPGGGGGW